MLCVFRRSWRPAMASKRNGSSIAPPRACWMSDQPPKTAVVFSAGGMYGAWEVGVWKALAPVLRPDIVVGASIGAVNGYAVAGGCPAEELERQWLALDALARVELQVPWGLRGIVN